MLNRLKGRGERERERARYDVTYIFGSAGFFVVLSDAGPGRWIDENIATVERRNEQQRSEIFERCSLIAEFLQSGTRITVVDVLVGITRLVCN